MAQLTVEKTDSARAASTSQPNPASQSSPPRQAACSLCRPEVIETISRACQQEILTDKEKIRQKTESLGGSSEDLTSDSDISNKSLDPREEISRLKIRIKNNEEFLQWLDSYQETPSLDQAKRGSLVVVSSEVDELKVLFLTRLSPSLELVNLTAGITLDSVQSTVPISILGASNGSEAMHRRLLGCYCCQVVNDCEGNALTIMTIH